MRMVFLVHLVLVALLTAVPVKGFGAEGNQAGDNPAASNAESASEERSAPKAESNAVQLSETTHVLDLPEGSLEYTAQAGEMLVQTDKTGEKAKFFFVAYQKSGEERENRPITFAFNGGPGAGSVWLHLGGLGPKIIEFNPDGTPPPPPATLSTNPLTWLSFTDLVFIDPVGTGFSTSLSEGKPFWEVQEDVRSVGEFIRLFLTTRERWRSPKFLVGESYGSTRAAALSDHLEQTFGIRLNGIVLISPVLDFSTVVFDGSQNLPYVLALPTYAATAAYHGRAGQEDVPFADVVAEAEAYALTGYLLALHHGAGPPAQQKEFVRKTAELTGLPEDVVARQDGRIGSYTFVTNFFKDQNRFMGIMDTTVLGVDPDPADDRDYYDPSLRPLFGPFSSTINAYVREELGFETTAYYEILNTQVNRSWDWSSSLQRSPYGQGYINHADDLKRAMAINPHLNVFLAGGYFDLATPYFATRYTISRMNLDEALGANLHERVYPAGHMIYLHAESRKNLFLDVRNFYREALP
ncbi:MAG: S10 family peptidase [Desulfovibrionales bacterium]